MSKELLEKLRKAGFVFRTHLVIGDGVETEDSFPEHDPTLSELIEACGSKFGALMVGPGLLLWTARGNGVEVHDATPEIAVARLWLALHGKD